MLEEYYILFFLNFEQQEKEIKQQMMSHLIGHVLYPLHV